MPAIAIEIVQLVQQQDVNIKQIANTIQHDPALSTKILKTVNSSFYGQAHPISSISHALVILGLNAVKTLALGFSLVNNLHGEGGEGFDHGRYWQRCVYSAVASRLLAQKLGLVQQEEAFLGGLLQDLGLLAMNQTLGQQYLAVLAQAGPQHRNLAKVEREMLGVDHAEMGAILAESWRLPPLLINPIRYHEDQEGAPEELLPLIHCVAVGGDAADVFSSEAPGEPLDAYYRKTETCFSMARDSSEPLLKSIHAATQEMRRLFDLPEELSTADDIIASAHEALMQITLQQSQQTDQLVKQASELEERNQQLVKQASTDSLTGAANRRSFNEFIAACFEATSNGESGPLSVLFLDTDHFKRFNDTYGHQVGDRVLVEKSSVLKDAAPEGAMVARYGGEEFAVVCPDTDRLTATRLAEQIRKLIESTRVASDDGEELSITASIGVSTFDGTFFKRAEQLVKAADQAVYAAKESGRNCVRVFTPRVKAAG